MQKQTPALLVKDWPKVQKTPKIKKSLTGEELQYLISINRDALTMLQDDITEKQYYAKMLWEHADKNNPDTEKFFEEFSKVRQFIKKSKHHYKQLSKVQATLKGMR